MKGLKELFDNPVIGCAYGFITALLGGLFMLGEDNLWAFSLVFGVCWIAAKEVLNRWWVGNFFNWKMVLASVISSGIACLFFV